MNMLTFQVQLLLNRIDRARLKLHALEIANDYSLRNNLVVKLFLKIEKFI